MVEWFEEGFRVKPFGGHPRAPNWTPLPFGVKDRGEDGIARARDSLANRRLVEESLAGEIHPAELRLTDCDAGICEICTFRDSTDDAWDEFLQCRVSGPLTYRITEK